MRDILRERFFQRKRKERAEREQSVKMMRTKKQRELEAFEDLRSENENLKKRNKELQDKAENERNELQLQNDKLKEKLQKLKHLILTDKFFEK